MIGHGLRPRAHLKSLYVLNELANGIRQVRRGESISRVEKRLEPRVSARLCFCPTCWSVISGHRSRSSEEFSFLS